MNKKRLFAIVLFIVLGLFMFTFANPRNNKDDRKLNGDIITPEEQETTKEPEITTTEEETTTVITTPVVNNNQVKNNNQPKVVPTIDLSKDKQQAIDELNNHKGDYEFTNDEEYNKVIEEYTDKINNSDTKDEINKKLEDGKDKIDELIEKDLQEYKDKAKEEVKQHAEDLGLENIEVILNNINQDIDNQTTKALVDEAKERGFDLLDDLLEAERANAIKELEEYKKDYPFNEENKKAREEIVEKGSKNINAATTISEIKEELKEAKDRIDDLIKKDLKEYKEQAKEKINNIEKETEYSKENQEKINNIKEQAKEDIKNAQTNEAIDKIVDEAEKKIEDIQKLKDTKFKVKFEDKNGNIISEQDVLYNNAAVAPENVADVVYKDVTYSFNNWSKDYTNIKEDLTIKAEYKITKILAQVYLNNFKIPKPKTKSVSGKGAYSFFKKVELKINNEALNAAIISDKYTDVATNDNGFDIRSLLVNPDELPLVDGKYKTYEYYVLKFIAEGSQTGVHIDVKLHYDEAQEQLDLLNAAKDSAIDNISNHLTDVQVNQDLVDKTINKYVDKINDAKTIEEVKEIEKEALAELDKIEIVDTKAPVIRLNGNRIINVEVYGTYTELGATMADDYDEGTNNLQPSGIHYYKFVNGEYKFSKAVDSIDTTKLGMYKVSYSYTDKAGNKSVNALNKNSHFVIREVYVKDTTAPLVRLNGARVLNVELDEAYIELGATMTDNYDEIINNLQPSLIHYYKNENGKYEFVKKVDSVDTSKEGMYKISYSYTDLSGNKSVNALNKNSKHVVREVYVIDSTRELRNELNALLDEDYTKYQNTKTTETYNTLINTVKENEEFRNSKNKEELKEAIAAIKDAIKGLVDIKLERIELDNVPSGKYFVGDLDDTSKITVKAIYNDSNKNRVLGEDEYKKNGTFDSTSSGSRSIEYSYKDETVEEEVTATYSYIVTAIEITGITLSSNNDTYYVNDQIKNDITLTVTYNDSRKNRTYTSNEYTVDGFYADKTGTKTATIIVKENTKLTADYTYTVKYSEQQLSDLFKDTTAYVYTYWGNYYIVFYNLPTNIEDINIIRYGWLADYNIKPVKTTYSNVYAINITEYELLRHNLGNTIDITYKVDGQEYTRTYGEVLGEIR